MGMKKWNKLFLACWFLAGIIIFTGCALQNNEDQSKRADKTVSSGHVAEKKQEKSEDKLTRLKLYDADGTCTMDISYEYNEKGKEVHRVQKDYGKVKWTHESFYTYPDAVTRLETYIDQDTGVRNQVDTTAYNKAGKIQTETSTDYDKEGYSNIMSQKEYTYDKQGNLILKEEHSTATVGAKLNNITKTEYTYDKAGNCLTEKQIHSREGQEDKVWSDIEYKYDSKGNKIREINHIAEEYTNSPIVYQYNGKNQLIRQSWYKSTEPDTLKQYFVYEYDKNGNRKKYNCYSADDELLSYAEYEYTKMSELRSKEKSTLGKDSLYKTWKVDGTASSTFSFKFIDPATGISCVIKNFDLRTQQEGIGGASSYAEVTDNTMKISCGPEEYITFSYWFEADGTLKLKEASTGKTISLHQQ